MRPNDVLPPQVRVIFKDRRRMELGFYGLRRRKEVDLFCGGERKREMDGFMGERIGEVGFEMV